jgi:hypothetical protein
MRPELKNLLELVLYSHGFKKAHDLANRLNLFFSNIDFEGTN